MRGSGPVFRAVIRHCKRQVAEAQPEFVGVGICGAFVKRRPNRRKHRSLQPRRRFAVLSQRRLHVHRGNGMISVKLDVVFPAPDHLHRLSRLLRNYRCFHCKVGKRFPAKRAAQQRDVHRHIFFSHTHRCGDCVPCPYWTLRRRPSLHFSVAIVGQRRRRLHRRVRQQGRVILRFHDLPALRKRRIHVANFPHHFSRLPRCLLQLLFVSVRVKYFVWALLPLYFQLFPPLHRRPGIVCHHRDSAERLKRDRRFERVNRHRAFHSRYGARRRVIHRLHLAP